MSNCVRCGYLEWVGELPHVLVAFTPADLAQLAKDTLDPKMQQRLLCALGTVDHALELETRAWLADESALVQAVAR